MRKTTLILALVALVGVGAFAANNPARGTRVNTPLSGGAVGEAIEAVHTLDYFFSGPAGTYTWGGSFYMSNMFKPDPTWYPFGIMTVEVNPGKLEGANTTGAAGTIDGVRIFTGAGPTVNVAATRLNLPTAVVGTWYPRHLHGRHGGGDQQRQLLGRHLEYFQWRWRAPGRGQYDLGVPSGRAS